jgi:riboflavin biosynthesis pyrimidine reductase
LDLDFSALNPAPITGSLVVGSRGETIGPRGNSNGLATKTDRGLLDWFRSRSQIVLTGGRTAEIENYSMPSQARLAIFTASMRNYPQLAGRLDEVVWPKADNYSAALQQLSLMGFTTIHTEFGSEGFVELVDAGFIDGYVSSNFASGIAQFCHSQHLDVAQVHKVSDLVIGQVIGRGRA